MSKGWIGVDLDGTLAEYDNWRGVDHIGAPVPAMMERVRGWLAQGLEVRIFTARVCGLIPGDHQPKEGLAASIESAVKARFAIKSWLADNGLPDLAVTSIKDYQMDELYDDRCVSIEKNTGRMLSPSPRGLATP